jgi:hypothetical protein
MDDPTRRCENDTDNGTRHLGLLFPSKGPAFLLGGTAPSAPSHALSARDESWLFSSTTCLEICSR